MEPELPQKKNRWQRIRAWVHRHRTVTYITVVLVLMLAAGAVTFFVLYKTPVKVANMPVITKPEPAKPAQKYYSPLTGLEMKQASDATEPVTAVMIENSPDARPQSGLKQAGVVFEAIAEGGITRFMALYQQAKPQLIGPVRSLRQYDIDWFKGFDASIAHVGGSLYALQEVRNGNYRDLDQFFNGAYYWRATDRYSPHNVYTSFAKLDALNQAKGYTSSQFTGFARTDGAPSKTPDATTVAINFSSALYNTTYAYDATTNTYARSEGGAPHLDREAGQITPSVVIALHVDEQTVMQDGYRQSITTIGSGQATIFQNGIATDATWSKASQSAPLTFTDTAGNTIPLVRGQTWIAAVPNGQGSVSWQ